MTDIDNDSGFDPERQAGTYSEDDFVHLPDATAPWEATAELDRQMAERDAARARGDDPDGDPEGGFGSTLSDDEFLRAAEFAKADREGNLDGLAGQNEFQVYFKKSLDLLRAGIEAPLLGDLAPGESLVEQLADAAGLIV